MIKGKKLLAVLLAMLMIASLAGCGSNGSSDNSTNTSSAAETQTADTTETAKATSTDSGTKELTPVTIQLKWVQQAQFMGYYAALELGIYKDYGLDVTIVPGGSVDVVDEVDAGRAQFGVTWVSTLMQKVSDGSNVVAVEQYYQNSGMTLVSLKDTVADGSVVSSGESTGNWGGGNEYEMQAYLASLGLPTSFVTQDYDMEQLLSGELNWASAMTYNELGLVLESGKTLDDLNVISMEDAGFGMLEDCLIANSAWAEANEDTVTAFLEASNLGWEWCLENQPAAGSLVFNAKDTANTVSEYHQQYEASEVAKLVAGSIITPKDRATYSKVGYLDADKYQQTYDILSKYVDVSNISPTSVYTTYFYDIISKDDKYLTAIDNLDSYKWDSTYSVLYAG